MIIRTFVLFLPLVLYTFTGIFAIMCEETERIKRRRLTIGILEVASLGKMPTMANIIL